MSRMIPTTFDHSVCGDTHSECQPNISKWQWMKSSPRILTYDDVAYANSSSTLTLSLASLILNVRNLYETLILWSQQERLSFVWWSFREKSSVVICLFFIFISCSARKYLFHSVRYSICTHFLLCVATQFNFSGHFESCFARKTQVLTFLCFNFSVAAIWPQISSVRHLFYSPVKLTKRVFVVVFFSSRLFSFLSDCSPSLAPTLSTSSNPICSSSSSLLLYRTQQIEKMELERANEKKRIANVFEWSRGGPILSEEK